MIEKMYLNDCVKKYDYEDKLAEKEIIALKKGYVNRFIDDCMKMTKGQKQRLNKLCDTDELRNLFLTKFYNEDDSIGSIITRFKIFKLKEGFGQDIKALDIEEEIFRKNWVRLTYVMETLMQEDIPFWKIKIMLRDLDSKEYDIQYIIDKHKENIFQNFICIMQ